MGDRAKIVIKDAPCAMYVHWGGHGALELLQRAIPGMRKGDEQYSMARLIGHAHTEISGNTGLGVVPAPEDCDQITEDYSPGDAGVIVYDCDTGTTTLWHGHLADQAQGHPLTLPTPPAG